MDGSDKSPLVLLGGWWMEAARQEDSRRTNNKVIHRRGGPPRLPVTSPASPEQSGEPGAGWRVRCRCS